MGIISSELKILQRRLGDNYGVKGIDGFNNCDDIATYLAFLLMDEGKAPEVWEFAHSDAFNPFVEVVRLIYPIPYRARNVLWGVHRVCVCGELAYEPALGAAVPKEEYDLRLFGENLAHRVHFNTEYLKRLYEWTRSIVS